MVLSLSVTALAATTATVTYPVGGVSSVGFLADDDGVVDLDVPVTSTTPVSYGDTVYYPLLNTEYGNASSGDADVEKAKAALDKAQTAYDAAKKAYDEAVEAAAEAQKAYEEALASQKGSNKALFDNARTALTAYEQAKKELDAAQSALSDKQKALTSAKSALAAEQKKLNDLNKLTDSVIAARLEPFFPAPATITDIPVANIPASTFPETTAVGSAYAVNLTGVTLADAKTATRAKVDAAAAACETAIEKAESNVTKAQADVTAAQATVSEKTTPCNAKKVALQKRLDVINALFTPPLSLNAETVTASDLSDAEKKDPGTGSQAAIDEAKAAVTAANKKVTSAASVLETRKTALDAAQKAYDEASKKSNDNYRFVSESSAVSNARVTASWDSGKKYIGNVSIVRKAAVSSVYSLKGATASLGSSSSRIYFVAVETKSSGSKISSDDADGTIKLKKSGTNGFNIESGVSLWLEYSYAESDGLITATPRLFEEGDGFYEDEDFVFYFEEDDSYFEVNTKGQKEILLAFNNEYDDRIADQIAKKNPDADLDFYNGNNARFKRTGKLYLSYPDKKGYVYAIGSSGNLTLVTNAKYDSGEEAFVISTNTLGRYLISNEKLAAIASDSSSSSSSSASASVSPTPPPPSSSQGAAANNRYSSSYNYTPSQSSRPASSQPSSSKPASSSSAPSSSSSSSSSESSSSSKESSSSSKESSSYEEVLVSEPTSNSEVPTKQKGVPWLVWLLIFAGLAAILVAVGVIFYTHRNSGDRMF